MPPTHLRPSLAGRPPRRWLRRCHAAAPRSLGRLLLEALPAGQAALDLLNNAANSPGSRSATPQSSAPLLELGLLLPLSWRGWGHRQAPCQVQAAAPAWGRRALPWTAALGRLGAPEGPACRNHGCCWWRGKKPASLNLLSSDRGRMPAVQPLPHLPSEAAFLTVKGLQISTRSGKRHWVGKNGWGKGNLL